MTEARASSTEYFTFALYFSEKKSKQLCQLLDDFPFHGVDGSSGMHMPPLIGTSKRVRGVKLVAEDIDGGEVEVKAIDNRGETVDGALIDVLLQKASVDMDEGRQDKITAIQRYCDAAGIRVVDPFERSLAICSSREYISKQLSGGPAGDGFTTGRTAIEMLNFWGFLIPSSYKLRVGRLKPEDIFEEPNAPYKADVMIVKPLVASQRSYSHDLQLIRTEELVDAVEGNRLADLLVGAKEGCTEWIAQDCLSLLALPVVYKAYIAGDYLSIVTYDAEAFNIELVSRVSNVESCGPTVMKEGSKSLFTPLTTLTERRDYHERGPVQAESIDYFAKGTKNYDDLWQTIQYLKRPENLGINFFGMDILVIKGIDGLRDRRYIVDVNYLPSYKNEVPARLLPAIIKTLLEIHQ